jgi:hypothetical protein
MRLMMLLALVAVTGCDDGGPSKSIYDFVPETYDLSVHSEAVQECIALGMAFNARVEDCTGLLQETPEVQLEGWAILCQPAGLPPPGFRGCGSVWANGTCQQVEAACCVMWDREHECSMVDRCEDSQAQGREPDRVCAAMGF